MIKQLLKTNTKNHKIWGKRDTLLSLVSSFYEGRAQVGSVPCEGHTARKERTGQPLAGPVLLPMTRHATVSEYLNSLQLLSLENCCGAENSTFRPQEMPHDPSTYTAT